VVELFCKAATYSPTAQAHHSELFRGSYEGVWTLNDHSHFGGAGRGRWSHPDGVLASFISDSPYEIM
jgi:hypothetical protein